VGEKRKLEVSNHTVTHQMRLSGINKAEIGIFYKIFWKGLIFPFFIGLKKLMKNILTFKNNPKVTNKRHYDIP